jgi:hypothetical protein
MKSKPILVLGLVLIALSLATFVHPKISHKTNEEVIQVGPMQTTVQTSRVFTVPPVLSGLVLVAGCFLVFVGIKRP